MVEKFIGDAVMSVFGLHTAREYDSERSVRAALVMQESLEELNGQLQRDLGIKLSMRVGIHAGGNPFFIEELLRMLKDEGVIRDQD